MGLVVDHVVQLPPLEDLLVLQDYLVRRDADIPHVVGAPALTLALALLNADVV